MDQPSENDLPEDRCSSVLLLGVTRIPTSPSPARRPSSLPLPNPIVKPTSPIQQQPPPPQQNQLKFQKNPHTAQERRTSFCASALRKLNPTTETEKCGKILKAPLGSAFLNKKNFYSGIDKSNADNKNLMEKSVDSIGTCSLDVEKSADLSDWSEVSSTGTLHSASVSTTPTPQDNHLPSYLSLACTVNGYSNTTNYNSIRLTKSRDASPLRYTNDNLTPKNSQIYCIKNNLLSPPNLVPLPPIQININNNNNNNRKMSDNMTTLTSQQHHEFYKTTTKTMTYINKENYTKNIYSNVDNVDGCYENGHNKINNKFSSQKFLLNNKQEYSNGSNGETKSFIEQRVERLYGPGALAQGFFVTKKDKTENEIKNKEIKTTITLTTSSTTKTTMSISSNNESNIMKQSTSSPTLPVLRHLRPEFRAQLPISVTPRKSCEMQKSCTVPILKEQVNGREDGTIDEKANSLDIRSKSEETVEKDGHYFMKVLQRETDRLLQLADLCEQELSNDGLSEDIIGKIRSASGKARLLVSQKMQQFKGLCTNNITQVAGDAFPTTNEDLQGFWDMVMLQVDQVDALFAEINSLKANNWIEIKSDNVNNKIINNGINNKITKKIINRTKPSPTPSSLANEEARKQREAQRKQMIEARRKAMKAQQQNGTKNQQNIEIFVPESS